MIAHTSHIFQKACLTVNDRVEPYAAELLEEFMSVMSTAYHDAEAFELT